MRQARSALQLVLVAALLAGCTLPDPAAVAPRAPEAGADDDEALRAQALLSQSVQAAAPPRGAPLEGTIALSTRWAKPLQPMEATLADADGNASVAWYIGLRGGDLRLTLVREEPYASTASPGDDHHHHGDDAAAPDDHAPSPARARADPGALEPGGAPAALTFGATGRYLLAADQPGARVNVTVRDDAPPDAASQAFLLVDGSGVRFVPEELDVRPGTRILFWNQADRPVDVRERQYLLALPGSARERSFTPVDEGVYEVHALLRRDDGRHGTARATFLVDFERPSERLRIGPYAGEFRVTDAATGAPAERAVRLNATYALRSLDLRFQAESDLPEDAAVRVEVLDAEGAVVAAAASDGTGALALADLPRGLYTLRVTPERGTLVSYQLEGEARYDLPTPAGLDG